MPTVVRTLRVPLAAAAVLALSACGGGSGSTPGGGGQGTITGLVVKGPIQAATVTAFPLDASMNRGTALANAPTMPDGTFTLSVPPYNGALEIVAFGGTYPEEAVGVPVQLTHELSFVVPAFQSGASVTATVSPISSVARSLAKAAIARGSSLSDSVTAAWTHVNTHFGGLDWRTIQPTSLTPSQPITVTMSDATKAGLILAGISQAARTMAEASGLSPGTSVTGGTLSGAEADDATDGTLDGMAFGTALVQGSAPLTSYTFRRVLGQAIVKFIGTPYNKTQLVAADVTSLANALAADSDPYLFCPNQTAAPACAGGSLQLEPPAIAFLSPPTFVGTTTVTLQVTATDPIANVSAVYAQTASGAQVAGAFSAGVWALSDIPLVEGPNVIYIWGVDAAGTGSLATATQITVTRDTLPLTPYVSSAIVSYYDERPMTLANGSVPPTYAFPAGAVKVSPIVAGSAYKAATRLSWTTQPTATILEGTNPDNIPFVQFALPVSPTRAPTSTATYSINDGTTTFTGDLVPWRSSSSTSSTEYYDVPLSANVVPTLATTAAGSLALTVSATFTNAVGTSATSSAPVTFAVTGPPLFISEDTAYGTYNDPRSTYPYKLATQSFPTLWNTSSTSFVNNQVRLVRYLVTNPTPFPVAIAASMTQDGGGSWRSYEDWERFDAGARDPGTYVSAYDTGYVWIGLDGQSMTDPVRFCVLAGGYGCLGPTEAVATAYPCPMTGTQLMAHVHGSTTRWTCIADNTYATGHTSLAGSYSTSDVNAAFFQGPPMQGGGEVLSPANATGNAMVVVPAASGSIPGSLVLYVQRPLTATRNHALAWNAVTASNRYEVWEQDFFPFAGQGCGARINCVNGYSDHIGGIYLASAQDQLNATLSLTTSGLAPGTTNLIGQTTQQFSAVYAARVLTTH